MMATIYDVAARAGVSPATVSRVFNGSNVSPALAEKVRDAASELKFVANKNARRLRTQRSEFITVMVPDIENPFYTSMTRAVEDVARAAGFSVLLCNTDDDEERFAEYLRAVVSEPVAGIVAVVPTADSKLDLAIERRVPIVCVDRRAPRYALDAVVVDNVRSARLATEGLFESGHARVACVTGPENVETAGLRLAGWRQAYQEAGRPAPEELVRHVPFTVGGGEDAVRDLLALPEPPDAIFAANNKLAAGVIRGLFDRGVSFDKVGVTSLGGLPLVTWQPRGIQVWHLPARDLGTEAAHVLLSRIRGEDAPPRTIVLDTLTSDDQDGYDRID
ncbi:MAG: LacI family DNA-binding transcriptional regulator [Propionibacteriaceae bacterium]|nr:LacI family DNA-binding transcriptional regulator [Propionibacteriaceae bacterium]